MTPTKLDAEKMDAQLKSCPFCGAIPNRPQKDGYSDERNGYNFCVQIACGCGARIGRNSHSGSGGWCDDSGQAEREAVEAWNRRA